MANILFFLSGASSLIYQICWIRLSSLIFGSTIAALSITTAVFFGGMALGNYLIVRKPREFTPKLYAILEFSLVILGLFSILHFKFAAGLPFTDGFMGFLPQLLLTIVAVGFPATLMGASFPVMVGLTKENSPEKKISGVYFINSLGAVFGTVICGFVLLQFIGIQNSIFVAAAIGLLITVAIKFVFSKNAAPAKVAPTASLPLLPVILFAVVGFNGMLAEIVANRFLALIITNTIFVYTLTISFVILGLSLGAGIFGKIMEKLPKDYNWFGILAFVWAAIFGAIFFLIPTSFWMTSTAEQTIPSAILITALVAFFPSLISGAMFPAAINLTNSKSSEKIAGVLSGVNTLGGICGSLLAGFVLLPTIGIANTVVLAIAVSMLIALLSICKYSPKKTAALIVLLPVAVLFFGQANYKNFIRNYLSFGKRQTLLVYQEGREAVVSVLTAGGIRTMEIDRLWQGENRKTRQIMAAHIPVIISKDDPKNVLLIGFGTGLTASRFLYYDIENLVCVDIERAVFDFAKSEFGADFLNNDNVRALVEDGRNTVRRNDMKYDIISVEIGQVFRSHSAGFYTKEFYEAAAKQLSTNGIISQFVPIASFNFHKFQSVIKTFISVFPNSQLWYNGSEFLLLGTNGEFSNLSSERARNIFEENQNVLSDLHWSYWGGTLYPLSDRRILAANFLMGRHDLASIAIGGVIFTDDLPILEYYAAVNRQNKPYIDTLKEFLSPIEMIIPEVVDRDDLLGIEGIREKNLGDIIASELFFAYTNQIHPVPALLEEVLKHNPLNLHALSELASIRYEQRNFEESVTLFGRALVLDQENTFMRRQYSLALIQLDMIDIAIENLMITLYMSPDDFIAHTILAGLMLQRQNFDLATMHVEQALQIRPNYPEALRMHEYLRTLSRMQREALR